MNGGGGQGRGYGSRSCAGDGRVFVGSDGRSQQTWEWFVENRGRWVGRRGLYDGHGEELLDLRSAAVVKHGSGDMRSEGEEGFREDAEKDVVKWETEAYRESGETETEVVEWAKWEVEQFGAAVEGGSFSIGPKSVSGENFKVDQCVSAGEMRVLTSHAFSWEGRLCGLVVARERREEVPSVAVFPSAWRSPSALFDYFLGTWEGTGQILHRIPGTVEDITTSLKVEYSLNGDLHQTSSLSVTGGPSRKVQATARRDGAVLCFTRAGVEMQFLSGGVSIAGPMMITRGEPFVVELAFLVRPDERKRIARCYNAQGSWINTVFINERRVASVASEP